MTKVVLYMAISVDGYIAGENDDVDWVSEDSWQSYLEFVRSCDSVVVGKKTFAMMPKDEFISDTNYFVATNDSTVNTSDYEKISIKSKQDLPNGEKIGIIGGGTLNGSLAILALIDEVILDVEPIMLGSGKKLFGEQTPNFKLELLGSKRIGSGTIQNHYKVLNKHL